MSRWWASGSGASRSEVGGSGMGRRSVGRSEAGGSGVSRLGMDRWSVSRWAESRSRASRWRLGRQGLGALAVVTAALTGELGILLGGSGWHVLAGSAYVLIAAFATFSPAAIAVQVVAGQALVGSLLLGRDGPSPLLLVGAVAGVILTAELLAIVARMDAPITSEPRNDLTRAGVAAVIGAVVFGVVLLATGFPGPSGPLAIGLAGGACFVVATLLARGPESSQPPKE
jgi:hypothetical protein